MLSAIAGPKPHEPGGKFFVVPEKRFPRFPSFSYGKFRYKRSWEIAGYLYILPWPPRVLLQEIKPVRFFHQQGDIVGG